MSAPQIDYKSESLDVWEFQRIRNFWLKLLADLTVWLRPVVNYLMAFAFVAAFFNIFKAFFVKIPLLTASKRHEMNSKNKNSDDKEDNSSITSGSQVASSKKEEEIVTLYILKFLELKLNYLIYLLLYIENKLQEENLPLETLVQLIVLREQLIMEYNLLSVYILLLHPEYIATFTPQPQAAAAPENHLQANAPASEPLLNSVAPKFKPQPKFNPALNDDEVNEFISKRHDVVLKPDEKIVSVPETVPELSPPPAYEEAGLPPPSYQESMILNPTLSPEPSAPPVEKEDLSTGYNKHTTLGWQLYTEIQTVPVVKPVPMPSAPQFAPSISCN